MKQKQSFLIPLHAGGTKVIFLEAASARMRSIQLIYPVTQWPRQDILVLFNLKLFNRSPRCVIEN